MKLAISHHLFLFSFLEALFLFRWACPSACAIECIFTQSSDRSLDKRGRLNFGLLALSSARYRCSRSIC